MEAVDIATVIAFFWVLAMIFIMAGIIVGRTVLRVMRDRKQRKQTKTAAWPTVNLPAEGKADDTPLVANHDSSLASQAHSADHNERIHTMTQQVLASALPVGEQSARTEATKQAFLAALHKHGEKQGIFYSTDAGERLWRLHLSLVRRGGTGEREAGE